MMPSTVLTLLAAKMGSQKQKHSTLQELTKFVKDKYGYDSYEAFVEERKPIYPPDHKLRWNMEGLRMFLVAPFKHGNDQIKNMHLVGIDEVKGLVCPGLPNVFGDTRICMGGGEWDFIRDGDKILKDPLAIMQNALKSFLCSNSNSDLDSIYAYKSLKWDNCGNVIDTRTSTRTYNLPVVSTEMMVSFYKFMKKEAL